VHPAARRTQQADHERDRDRVVGAGLAFDDRAGTSSDLPAAEDRKDDRWVRRCQSRAQQHRGQPTEAEQEVREQRHPACRHRRACYADPDDGPGRFAESGPADVHAAVEEDHDKRNRHQPLIYLDREVAQRREDVGRDGRGDQEERGCRYAHSFTQPVREHGEHGSQRDDGNGKPERYDVIHRQKATRR
jgi:hypothetical protein